MLEEEPGVAVAAPGSLSGVAVAATLAELTLATLAALAELTELTELAELAEALLAEARLAATALLDGTKKWKKGAYKRYQNTVTGKIVE